MVVQDTPAELERFSNRLARGESALDMSQPFERVLAWELLDRTVSSRTVDSRLGMTLSVSRVTWQRAWELTFDPDPSKLKFIVARGPGPRITPKCGETHLLEGGNGHISRVRRSVELRFEFAETGAVQTHEELCLEIDRGRLCQLLGADQLPDVVEGVWASSEDYPFQLMSAPPASFRVLDEITHCKARGATRQLHLEAYGLELLAAWADHLDAEHQALLPLSVGDVECLERARSFLLARMTAPPRLPELARLAGLNEAKLKAGFRTHFGETVYGYLRQQRLIEAHRLLTGRGYNVTEVATRVGYKNPSKFAAAFKAHFGVSPSQVRRS
jgi:AraC-like DNA-binding protein